MKQKVLQYLIGALLFFGVSTMNAQFTWDGSTSTDFGDTTNWSGPTQPTYEQWEAGYHIGPAANPCVYGETILAEYYNINMLDGGVFELNDYMYLNQLNVDSGSTSTIIINDGGGINTRSSSGVTSGGTIIVKTGGKFEAKGYLWGRYDGDDAVIKVEGGILDFSNFWAWRNGVSANYSRVYLSNGGIMRHADASTMVGWAQDGGILPAEGSLLVYDEGNPDTIKSLDVMFPAELEEDGPYELPEFFEMYSSGDAAANATITVTQTPAAGTVLDEAGVQEVDIIAVDYFGDTIEATIAVNVMIKEKRPNYSYIQSNDGMGLIVMPAENYSSMVAGSEARDGDDWVMASDIESYMGDGFMRAVMIDGGLGNDTETVNAFGAKLSYDVEFVKTGTHYVWAYVYLEDGESDSFWFGLNGSVSVKLDGTWPSTYGEWFWDGGDAEGASFDVPTSGIHTITIGQREPGVNIDHIIITSDPAFDPTVDMDWETINSQKLRHSYTFEDGTFDATMVYDQVGSLNATIGGTKLTVADGKATVSGSTVNSDGWLSLDGVSLALNSYSAITLEAYVESGNALNAGYTMLAYFGTSTPGQGCFWIQPTRSGSETRMEANAGAAPYLVAAKSGVEIDDGKLHHVVGVLDADNLTYWLDGAILAQVPTEGNDVISGIGTDVANIFRGVDGWNDPNYNASIEEFNIYNGTMSPEQISSRALAYIGQSDSRLKAISLSSGELFPAFDPGVMEYAVAIPEEATSIDMEGTPMVDGATVEGKTVDVSSGMAKDTIKVTSIDGTSMSYYVITFTTVEEGCYMPSSSSNLVSDPEITDMANFGGWGTKMMTLDPEMVYCGLSSGMVNGQSGSIDVTSIPFKPETTYILKAMVYVESGEFRIGVDDGSGSEIFAPKTTKTGEWERIDTFFTTTASAGTGIMYFNNWSLSGTVGVIDNWELYELPYQMKHSYTFETADTVIDVIAGADGMLHGSMITVADGKATVSGATNPTDGYIALDAAELALYNYEAITLEAYIESAELANPSYTMLAYFGNNTGGNKCFWIQPTRNGNESRIETNNGETTITAALPGTEVDDGKKHHLVAILSADTLMYYLDGDLVASTSTDTNEYISNLDTVVANIFKGPDGWGDANYNASLEEFNIYDGVMDPVMVSRNAMTYLGASSSDLGDLTVSEGMLSPAFASTTTSYQVILPMESSMVTLTATPKYPVASVSGDGNIDVSSGDTTAVVQVVSGDESDTTEYRVQFVKLDPMLMSDMIIGHESSWGDNPDTYIDAAFDGDINTFVDAPGAEGYVGYDFGAGYAAKVTAIRYAPRSGQSGRMVGGVFLGTNELMTDDLSNADTIYMIEEEPDFEMSLMKLDNTESYRYIYYYSANGYCNISEMELYGMEMMVAEFVQDAGGTVSIPAEYYTSYMPGTGIKEGDAWEMGSEMDGFMDDGYMTSVMAAGDGDVNNANNVNAKLTYHVEFTHTGTHYIFCHVYFPDGSSDSFFWGLNGTTSGDRVQGSPFEMWKWTKGDGSVEVNEVGVHTIDIMQREPNAIIDHIVVTSNPNFNPEVYFCEFEADTANLTPDPQCTDINLWNGWGLKSIVSDTASYCGPTALLLSSPNNTDTHCGWPDNGAALDVANFVWEANTTYRLRAMVKTIGGSIGWLARGSVDNAGGDFGFGVDTEGEWMMVDTAFTTGASPVTGFFSFNTCDFGSTATETYIDNYELFVEERPNAVNRIITDHTVQLYPNPTNGMATLSFQLTEKANVSLSLYSVTGQKIAIVNAQAFAGGTNTIQINGSDLNEGMYIYTLTVDNETFSGKLSVIK